MDGRPPLAAFLFALLVAGLALLDAVLQGEMDRQALLVLAGAGAPVIAFGVLGLAPRRRQGALA